MEKTGWTGPAAAERDLLVELLRNGQTSAELVEHVAQDRTERDRLVGFQTVLNSHRAQ
ncbi:MAG: hypothetical protein ACRDQ5_28820 [Sciscionella sp.]